MQGFVHYTMWIHHGKTVVNVDLEEEAENLNYIDEYIAELDAQIDGHEKVVVLVVGMVTTKLVLMMVEDMSGTKMIW
jgi:hypothetical protein